MDEQMRANFIRDMQQKLKAREQKMIDQAIKDHQLLLDIQQLLDGKEWTVETIEHVAKLLDENGYPIGDL